jgi:fluoroquinolone resistance protein
MKEARMTSKELGVALEAGLPIEDIDLSGAEWAERECEGVIFHRCRFIGCRFTHVNFRGATFEDCIFLDKATSTGSTFVFGELREARLLRCDLSFCTFDRCKLFAIEMERCNLLGARFNHADFSHAMGRKLAPIKASLRRCNFELAQMAGIRLPECDLSGSIFREADLTDADLTGANFRDCDLEKCELLRAKLADADIRGGKIAGLNLLGLGSMQGLKVSQQQQWLLLAALGIEVHAD